LHEIGDTKMPQLITKFTQKIEYWALHSKIIYWLGSQYYQNIIQNEISLANITNNDHILCIGGGICPFSGILLHQATGAKVTVIDNNKNCVSKAGQVIRNLGLYEQMHVYWQDGGSSALLLSEYTVIHFAMQVCPMDYVFSKVKKHAKPGTKLLVRLPKKYLGSMYSCLPEPLQTCRTFISHKKAGNIGKTMLYIKQEQSYEKEEVINSIDDSAVTGCAVTA